MIIGISHITINSTNLKADIKIWESKGYNLAFINKDLPNHIAKKPWLAEYAETHSIALLTKPGSNSIELIQHHEKSGGVNELYLFDPLIIHASNYDKSLDFWTNGLGFGFNEKDGSLTKTMPMPQMSANFKIEKSDPKTCMLDYDGVTCIALYSSYLEADSELLRTFGAQISDEINVVVGNRPLQIRMIKGPSGEMLELISFSSIRGNI